MDRKVKAVLAMLARAGRLTVTPEDLAKFLEWKDAGSSLGAALMRGGLLQAYPLEMTMLFAAAEPGPLPTEGALWALGRAAVKRHRREERALDRQIREDDAREKRAVGAARRALGKLG